jgi:hypothetical protein
MMRLPEQGRDISFERGEAVSLLLLLMISYHYDMTHRKRFIHISHEHGDTVHTSTSTLSNNHSMKSAYGMHRRESVSFARFQRAQMRVFVPQCIFRERPFHTPLYTTYFNFKLPIPYSPATTKNTTSSSYVRSPWILSANVSPP